MADGDSAGVALAAPVSTTLPRVEETLSEMVAFRVSGGFRDLVSLLTDAEVPKNKVLETLQRLQSMIAADVDAAWDLAIAGLHAALQSLLESPCLEIQSEVYSVILASQRQGVAFRPRQTPHFAPRPPPTEMSVAELRLQLRLVEKRQSAQRDTGYVLWPAARLLAMMIRRAPEMTRGLRVLELGAGLGLCGFSAVDSAARVTLSDYNVEVLKNLRFNALLNFADAAVRPAVRFLDFHAFCQGAPKEEVATPPPDAILPGMEVFDVILGSDIVCCEQDAFSAAAVIADLLCPGGVAHIVLADPRNRYGVEALPAALQEVGLSFEACKLEDEELLAEVFEESSYLEWDYFLIRKEENLEGQLVQ